MTGLRFSWQKDISEYFRIFPNISEYFCFKRFLLFKRSIRLIRFPYFFRFFTIKKLQKRLFFKLLFQLQFIITLFLSFVNYFFLFFFIRIFFLKKTAFSPVCGKISLAAFQKESKKAEICFQMSSDISRAKMTCIKPIS